MNEEKMIVDFLDHYENHRAAYMKKSGDTTWNYGSIARTFLHNWRLENNITKPVLDYPVLKMATLMQHKFDKNKDKECAVMNPDGKGRRWHHCDIGWLQMRLLEEVVEMQKAILGELPPPLKGRGFG